MQQERVGSSGGGGDSAPFYVTGGTVPFDAASYVTRRADRDLLDGLLQGEFCYVLNARQMGKSSLSVRTMTQLAARGIRSVFLDLTKIGGQNVTAEQWYVGLLAETGRILGLRAEMVAYWRQNADRSLSERYFGALREVALERIAATADSEPARTGDRPTIVVFIDEIDATRSLPFSTDEFFAAIRALYNARVTDPLCGRIAFCLVGSALPSEIIRDTRISPFNIGRRIELCDFTFEEARSLARGLPGDGERLLRRVLYWTNGHPYLTQSICAGIAAESADDHTASHAAYRRPRDVDRYVDRQFVDTRARSRNVNLSDVSNRLLRHTDSTEASARETRASVLTLYRRVLHRRQRVADDETDPLIGLLKLSGITRSENGRVRVRSRLYERVFDERWIDENMPDAELRRQRAAYRRGMLRAGSVSAAVVLCLGTMTALIFGLNRELQGEKRQKIDQLDAADTAEGMRRLEAGDALGALAPLGEALRLSAESGDREREHAHRISIAATLAQAPRLVQMFSTGGDMVCADASPDGRRIVTADRAGNARLWDAETGAALTPILAHDQPLRYVSFSPDGKRVATVADHYARVWDAFSGQPVTGKLTNEPGPNDAPFFKWRHAEWSRDSRLLSTTDGNYAIVWDAETGRQVQRVAIHHGGVNDAPFSGDGTGIAVASGANLAAYVSVNEDKGRSLGDCFEGNRAVFSRDGIHVLLIGSFGGDGRARGAAIVDTRTGKRSSPVYEMGSSGADAAFSPDESRVVVGAAGLVARVFDTRTGVPKTPPMKHTAALISVAFSPDGNLVLTASADGTARVWDAHTGQQYGTAKLRHAGSVYSAHFVPSAPDRNPSTGPIPMRVLTTGSDQTARLWELRPTTVLPDAAEHPLTTPSYARIDGTHVERLADGYVLTASDATASDALGWQLHAPGSRPGDCSGEEEGSVQASGSGLLLGTSAARDRTIVSANGSEIPRVLDGRAGWRTFPLYDALPAGMRLCHYASVISPDGNVVLLPTEPIARPAQGYNDATVRAFDVSGHQSRPLPALPTGWTVIEGGLFADRRNFQSGPIGQNGQVFAPNSHLLLLARSPAETNRATELRLWDCVATAWKSPSLRMSAGLAAAAWGASENHLLLAGNDGTLAAFDVSSGRRLLATSSAHVGGDSPLGAAIVTNESQTIGIVLVGRAKPEIWDMKAMRPLSTRSEPIFDERKVYFSPIDPTRYVATDGDNNTWICDTSKGPVRTAQPMHHNAPLRALVFSPDGTRIATASEDSTARVWDANTGRPLTPPMPHGDIVTSVAFSSDGKLLATGCANGASRIWDAATGEPLTAPLRHSHSVRDVWFAPGDRAIVAAQARYDSGDVALHRWSVGADERSTDELIQTTRLLSGEDADRAGGFSQATPEELVQAWRKLRPAQGAGRPGH